MSKSKRVTRESHRAKLSQTWLWGIIIGSLLLIGSIVLLGQGEAPTEVWGLPATPRDPRPATLAPALFTGKVREAYRIAREAPELIERMPCYCGCYVSNRHQNNLDCYVDRHAVGWNICLDITLDAYAMYKQGTEIEQIKKAIDAKYAKHWPYEKKWPL